MFRNVMSTYYVEFSTVVLWAILCAWCIRDMLFFEIRVQVSWLHGFIDGRNCCRCSSLSVQPFEFALKYTRACRERNTNELFSIQHANTRCLRKSCRENSVKWVLFNISTHVILAESISNCFSFFFRLTCVLYDTSLVTRKKNSWKSICHCLFIYNLLRASAKMKLFVAKICLYSNCRRCLRQTVQ